MPPHGCPKHPPRPAPPPLPCAANTFTYCTSQPQNVAGGSPNAQTSLSLPDSLSPVIVATYVTAYASPDSIFPATYDPALSVWSTPDGYVCSPGDDGCYRFFWVRGGGPGCQPLAMLDACRCRPPPRCLLPPCGLTDATPPPLSCLALPAALLLAGHAAACSHAVRGHRPQP